MSYAEWKLNRDKAKQKKKIRNVYITDFKEIPHEFKYVFDCCNKATGEVVFDFAENEASKWDMIMHVFHSNPTFVQHLFEEMHIKSIKLVNNKIIPYGAFSSLPKTTAKKGEEPKEIIESISLSNSVVAIGGYALAYNKNLSFRSGSLGFNNNCVIPSSVKYFGTYSIEGTDIAKVDFDGRELRKVTLDDAIKIYRELQGLRQNRYMAMLVVDEGRGDRYLQKSGSIVRWMEQDINDLIKLNQFDRKAKTAIWLNNPTTSPTLQLLNRTNDIVQYDFDNCNYVYTFDSLLENSEWIANIFKAHKKVSYEYLQLSPERDIRDIINSRIPSKIIDKQSDLDKSSILFSHFLFDNFMYSAYNLYDMDDVSKKIIESHSVAITKTLLKTYELCEQSIDLYTKFSDVSKDSVVRAVLEQRKAKSLAMDKFAEDSKVDSRTIKGCLDAINVGLIKRFENFELSDGRVITQPQNSDALEYSIYWRAPYNIPEGAFMGFDGLKHLQVLRSGNDDKSFYVCKDAFKDSGLVSFAYEGMPNSRLVFGPGSLNCPIERIIVTNGARVEAGYNTLSPEADLNKIECLGFSSKTFVPVAEAEDEDPIA